MTLRLFRVLLFLGACAVLFSSSAQAEDTAGINITVYNNYGYNNAPPLPGADRIIGTMVGSRIDHNFDSQPLFNSYEDFVVKYEGFITAPCTCAVRFLAQADDGTQMYLDGSLITNDWLDKGGGGSVSQPVQFQDGVSKQVALWFYENGGGAWVQLWWLVDAGWVIVPDSAFSTMAVWTTTTMATTTSITSEPSTTSSSSTSSSTTTTLPDLPTTTSTLSLETTTLPSTTTMVSPSSSTASSISSSTIQTTTTMTPTSTSTTVSKATVSVPEASSSTSSPSTTQVTTTTIQNGNTVPELITPGQATELATNSEILATIAGDQATEIFEALVIDDLSSEELTQLVEAVQDAPTEVRESFEESINVFGGAVDSYVPLGSTVPVGTRRTLIVITLMTSMIPLPNKRK